MARELNSNSNIHYLFSTKTFGWIVDALEYYDQLDFDQDVDSKR